MVQADAWLPDLIRIGVPETYLGDGVIEKIAAKGLRLKVGCASI